MRAIAGDLASSVELRDAVSASAASDALAAVAALDKLRPEHPQGRRARAELCEAWAELVAAIDVHVTKPALRCALDGCEAPDGSRVSMCAACLKAPCKSIQPVAQADSSRRLLPASSATVRPSSPTDRHADVAQRVAESPTRVQGRLDVIGSHPASVLSSAPSLCTAPPFTRFCGSEPALLPRVYIRARALLLVFDASALAQSSSEPTRLPSPAHARRD